MGYACPVCEAPQADGEHLANHLAITAMLGRDDHADWLDEHAPGWEESSPEDVADQIVEAVPETEFPQIFEDTTDQHRHAHEHGHGAPNQGLPFEQELAQQTARQGRGRGQLTGEAQEIVARAREMTEQMLADDEGAAADDDDAIESDDEGESATDANGAVGENDNE